MNPFDLDELALLTISRWQRLSLSPTESQMHWHYHHPRAEDLLGFIPQFLNETDPRPAREQFDDAYAHGGGWAPFQGFRFDPSDRSIKYPGDPKHFPVAEAMLRDELILVYPYAWVAIVQKDGAVEIARMD